MPAVRPRAHPPLPAPAAIVRHSRIARQPLLSPAASSRRDRCALPGTRRGVRRAGCHENRGGWRAARLLGAGARLAGPPNPAR